MTLKTRNDKTNYKTLLMMIGLMSMPLAIAKTIDNLSVGDKDKTVFINTDQVMIKDGAVYQFRVSDRFACQNGQGCLFRTRPAVNGGRILWNSEEKIKSKF